VQTLPAEHQYRSDDIACRNRIRKTRIRIVCDPAVQTNEHHLKAKGKFGELDVVDEECPIASKPKTSYLAGSVCDFGIKKIVGSVWLACSQRTS